ncbi:hypothetical protein J5N97_022245 [Dioscorea zingiberensis]|uniref:Uroporphyrinogen-III synthase n=1 Tax=Dioscorea zingiberensis TaxID=325984 RepID=A0A9D5CAT6_9LILI|nr:hypothetical protein J5N97_022245 [Dioscorea zingiberensis]
MRRGARDIRTSIRQKRSARGPVLDVSEGKEDVNDFEEEESSGSGDDFFGDMPDVKAGNLKNAFKTAGLINVPFLHCHLKDYNVAKEYIEDIWEISDDFEGLYQRNVAANTGLYVFWSALAWMMRMRYPHEEAGQIPMAFVVRQPGSNLTELEVMEFVAKQQGLVINLEEPLVVPDFIRDLEAQNWVIIRVPAYKTRWAGHGVFEPLVRMDGKLDAIVFTSSTEVEGLLKGLEELGCGMGKGEETVAGDGGGGSRACDCKRCGAVGDCGGRR